MRSVRTANFRKLLAELPTEAKAQADRAYALFEADPFHPSLHFKRAAGYDDVFSARVGARYRALGIRKGDVIAWYWIGIHSEYDEILKS